MSNTTIAWVQSHATRRADQSHLTLDLRTNDRGRFHCHWSPHLHCNSRVPVMPVPWEAFIPMGLVVVMFGVTGTGFNIAKRATNDGKVGILVQ